MKVFCAGQVVAAMEACAAIPAHAASSAPGRGPDADAGLGRDGSRWRLAAGGWRINNPAKRREPTPQTP
ncbi:hypothetical protein [Streptomyces sp. NPDC056701]|uniref:hypothetical protein n=1 Tax=Streptomyces sp. NPDC056701 TaxID=3345916 RepID=UPI00369C295B